MGQTRQVYFLILLAGWSVIGNVRAEGSVTASNRQAQQILSADMERHVSVLMNRANRTTRSVISSVQSSQIIQSRRLLLQMEIDALRSQLGATTEISQREKLNQQIRQLEKKRVWLLSVN